MAIRAVIFDFGGVIMDMRWETASALEKEHGLTERSIADSLYASEAWQEIRVGNGDIDAWRREAHVALERIAGRALPPLHEHWRNDQRLIAENVDLIRRLRPPYLTQVLSNANSTLEQQLRETHNIAGLFDDILCSAAVGLAKPDPRIYELAATRLNVAPAECVFVDDFERNVEAARAAGMHAVHYRVDEGHSLEAQLAALGVVPSPGGGAPSSASATC